MAPMPAPNNAPVSAASPEPPATAPNQPPSSAPLAALHPLSIIVIPTQAAAIAAGRPKNRVELCFWFIAADNPQYPQSAMLGFIESMDDIYGNAFIGVAAANG